ncbi:uncharacterized protein TNCV_5027171 [Trichonephila clavipes]|nr:uncharacterized protein TNCV_5027171 [Trichonephila clavipes]
MKVERMMTRGKWNTNDFLAESQKLLEKAPTSKDAGLTSPAERMSNISKYPGHLPDFNCYDGNPRNQGLVGIDGACVRLFICPPKGRNLGRKGQASAPANLPDRPRPIHRPGYAVSNALRTSALNVQTLRHIGTTYEPLCWLEHFSVQHYILTYNYHHTVKSLCAIRAHKDSYTQGIKTIQPGPVHIDKKVGEHGIRRLGRKEINVRVRR